MHLPRNMRSKTKTMFFRSMRKVPPPLPPAIPDMSGLFILSSIMGLMPCAVDDGRQRWLVTYTVFTHIIYRVVNVSILGYYLAAVAPPSKSILGLLGVVTVVKCLCTTVHVFTVFWKRREFLELASSCEAADFTKNKYRTLTKVGIGFQLYLYTTGQIIQKNLFSAIRDVFSAIDVLSAFFVLMQYCTFLQIATKRLSQVNSSLIVHFYNPELVIDRHHKAVEFARLIGRSYSKQAFVCVFYFCFEFFVASFDSIERITTGDNYYWVICTTGYSSFCISIVFFLCRACRKTARKADKFNEELFKMIRTNRNHYINDKLKVYVAMKETVEFTACGFFTLNYSLLTTVVATATTYLVILSQFSFR